MSNYFLRFLIPILIIGAFLILSYEIGRSDTFVLLSLYSGIFVLLWYWIRNYNTLGSILLLGIIARLCFSFHLPELSQDFYRYLWDGQVQQLGMNPYLYTPENLIDIVIFPDVHLLFDKMGSLSAGNYSNYPPASQYIFRLAAFFSQHHLLDGVVILRSIYFIGELFLFFFGISFLKKLRFDPLNIAWYFLNPLVIIEGIGNLHGESLMCCFMLISLFFIIQKRCFIGGIFMGISVAIKLLPLLIIPVFYKYLDWRKFSLFCLGIGLSSVFFWVSFWEGNMASQYKNTIDLWFTTFEFNGSLYNILRAIGYKLKGYNIIRKLGQVTPFIVIGLVGIFTFIRSNRTAESLIKSILFSLSCYFFISTTVHPWYIINLLFFGILSGYAYPLVWSLTVFWSYSVYGNSGFEVNTTIQFFEYLIVYGVLFYELVRGPLGEHFQKPYLFET